MILWFLRVLGGVCIVWAIYFLASFFLPLPLPPMRDQRIIDDRRKAAGLDRDEA